MADDVAYGLDVAVDDIDVGVALEAVAHALIGVVLGAVAGTGDRVHALLDVLTSGRRLCGQTVQTVVAVEAPAAFRVVDETTAHTRIAACVFDGAAIVDPDGLRAAALDSGDEPSHAQQGWTPKTLWQVGHALFA